ncbi:radical SAM domain protein [Ruminococcus sp. CAG:624]|nr:radical SAM domain protein [Ruminococcus sp. CAG:624]
MKRILLVYPKPKFEKNPRFGFSIQLLQLSSILKKSEFDVYYIDYSYTDYNSSELIKYLSINKIETVVVEIDSFALKRSENSANAIEILKLAKENNAFTIAFGYDCIMDSSNVLFADCIVKENPFEMIPKILGVNIDDYYFSKNYDYLPYPDREILLTNDFFYKNKKSTLIRTAEGCLNTCTFCQRRGWQNSYKAHNIEYVVKEFKMLRDLKYNNIWIADENFTFNLNRAKFILNRLIEEEITIGMKISISSWANIDFEFLDLAKNANISIISMGIESANESILNFYDKKIDLQHTKDLISYADSLGIYTVGNFIIGAPMETIDTINNTFEFIKNSKLDQVNIKILDYMIGSKIYESLKNKEEHHYFACSENGLCSFSLQELTEMKDDFLSSFYKQKQKELKEKIDRYGVPYYPLIR